MCVCVCVYGCVCFLQQRNNAASSLSALVNHLNCLKPGRMNNYPVSSPSSQRLKYNLRKHGEGWFFTSVRQSNFFSSMNQHISLLFFLGIFTIQNKEQDDGLLSLKTGSQNILFLLTENVFDSTSPERQWHILQMSFPELTFKYTFWSDWHSSFNYSKKREIKREAEGSTS